MSEQLNFWDTAASICSPGSADGPKPCGLQHGPTQSPAGLARPLASRSAPPESAQDATTPAISAPLLSIWSGLPAPLCCLASKSPARTFSDTLQSRANEIAAARLHGRGATIYSYALKRQDTPHGRSIFRLRASAHRTSGSGASSPPSICDLPMDGWKTPNCPRANDSDGTAGKVYASKKQCDLPEQAWLTDWTPQGETPGCYSATKLSGWNTARATDGSNGGPNQSGGALPADAALAGWPTPMAGTPAQNGNNPAGNTDSSRKTVELAGWPTARANDGTGDKTPPGREGGLALKQTVLLANGPARLTASGKMLTGCSAGMASGGQLAPEFSLWLMGYQAAWVSCGERAMQSCRRQRRKPSPSPETP